MNAHHNSHSPVSLMGGPDHDMFHPEVEKNGPQYRLEVD